MSAPLLLLTRPARASARFAALAPDFRAVIAPLMRIAPVPHDTARAQSAPLLALTSPEAVAFAGPGEGRRAVVVGPGTAEAARAAGFAVEVSATGEAGGLAALLAGRAALHLHGRHLARDLGVEGMVVYDQIAQPLPEAGRAALSGAAPVLWPLFSPRSACLAAEAAATARAPLHPAAISAAAAAAWSALRPEPAPVAARPDAEALLALLRHIVLAGTFGREGG